MNCFEPIKTVLDKLYAAISGTAAKKDDAIKKRLDLFSKQYPSLLNGVRIDYKQPVSRFAYVYRYTTAHANMVTCSIQNNDTLRSLLEKEKFTVACVGGGPGSDFLGILKYLERNGGCGMRHLKCHLIDQEKAWDNCWSDLDEEIRSTGRLSTHFKQFQTNRCYGSDIIRPSRRKVHACGALHIRLFHVGALCPQNDARAYFQKLFRRMRRGATVLYLDNSCTEFSSWFDSFTQAPSFVGERWDREFFQMPRDEQKGVLGEYLDKFGAVKLTGRVACRVLVKK